MAWLNTYLLHLHKQSHAVEIALSSLFKISADGIVAHRFTSVIASLQIVVFVRLVLALFQLGFPSVFMSESAEPIIYLVLFVTTIFMVFFIWHRVDKIKLKKIELNAVSSGIAIVAFYLVLSIGAFYVVAVCL
jgi:hypothetical protein